MDYSTNRYVAFFALALTDLKSQKGIDEANYILNKLHVYPDDISALTNQSSDPVSLKREAYSAIKRLGKEDKSTVRSLFSHAYMNGGRQSDLYAVSIFNELILECGWANAII